MDLQDPVQNFVWDAHAGLNPSPSTDLNVLDEWRKSGVDYVSINIGFDAVSRDHALGTLSAYRRWILAHPERFALVATTSDIGDTKKAGRLSVSFDIEGTNALGGDANMVAVYHELGVRQMLFAYNLSNDSAGGCHGRDVGLSEYGAEILSEMNRVGMIVDASHASYRTSMDLIERSRTPVVFSHSNPRSVWKHERNISDEQIKACAARGGVIGLNGLGIFLGDNDIRNETLLRHLFYILDLVGPDHAGLGFDYSPDVNLGALLTSRTDYWPRGHQYDTPNIRHAGPACIPALTEGLTAYGLSKTQINGVLGNNFARVARATWPS